MLSKNAKTIVYAYSIGYRADASGVVTGSRGKTLKLKKSTLKLADGALEYFQFNVNFNGTVRPVNVHRFQAFQKYGFEIFKSGVVVRHLNSKSLDNRESNLALGTYLENCLDIPRAKRLKYGLNASQHVRKYSDDFLEKVFYDRHVNMFTYRTLKDKYGIAKSELSFLFNKSHFSKKYNQL